MPIRSHRIGRAARASHPQATAALAGARLPRLLAIPAIAGAGLLVVACGASSSSSDLTNGGAEEQQAETKLADFAKCLREHGVNAGVATLPGGGRGLKMGGGRAGKDPGLMESAQKACAQYRPEPSKVNLSPQQKVEHEEDVQKFAKCMREHGIKVEGSVSGAGIEIRIQGHPGAGPNPESPAFHEAQSECQKLLPKAAAGG